MSSKSKIFMAMFLFVVVLAQVNFAQNGKIKGIVVDANSGEALIGANVMIAGTSIGAAANVLGEFSLSSIQPGEYTLKISYVGYKEKTEKVTVVPNRALKQRMLERLKIYALEQVLEII